MSPRRSQPKRGGKHTFAVPGDPAAPDGFSAVASDWLEWLAAHNYAHMTLVDHSYWLATFATWLVRYLAEARPHLVRDEAVPAVFLATNGERLGATWLTGQVHRYVEASGTGKAGSCHLFRHSAATLMLEGGADIRYVQELLGHRSLASTHIYTRVAPERLAAVHAATHPGAALPGHGQFPL